MKIVKTLVLAILILFAATAVHGTYSSNQIHVYEYSPASHDLVVQVKNPLEAYPNQTVSINITVEASVDLTIKHLAIELYTFNDSKFDDIIYVEKGNPVPVSSGKSLNKIFNVTFPEQASNIVYGKLILEWTKKGTEEGETIEKEPTFIMTYLRNPELESLRSKVPELEENVTKLNRTLTDALSNLTDLENRYEGGLGDTRSVVTILAITTIFFAVTTVYLFTRKPKQYW